MLAIIVVVVINLKSLCIYIYYCGVFRLRRSRGSYTNPSIRQRRATRNAVLRQSAYVTRLAAVKILLLTTMYVNNVYVCEPFVIDIVLFTVFVNTNRANC